MEKKGLGRGLSALLAEVGPEAARPGGAARGQRAVPIDRIRPNPDQPRRAFDAAALEELAASIREKGVIQPLILRPHPGDPDGYEIVAGERRWRAAQIAGVHDLPAVVRDLGDDEALELAIIENVQRADLSPVEEAQGYRQLMDRFGHTQERLAEGLGKSRSHIANLLRLLTLPEPVLEHLRAGRLSAGHARALVGLAEPEPLARRIVDLGLSVRQAEALARDAARPKAAARPQRPAKDADTRALEADLSAALGMPVAIDHRRDGAGGEIRIRYASLDQLDGLCQRLTG
jgi:ParB family chromosome partitioning protein